jgi:HK97 family phage major capsid protein
MSHELIKKLHTQHRQAWEAAKALLDHAESEGRDLTAEENEQYRKMNEDIDAYSVRARELADAEARAEASEATFAELLAKPQEREVEPKGDELRSFLRGESGRGFEVMPEARDLTKGTATAGGNTVPTSFYGKLWEHMIEVSGVLAAGATVLRTASGENFEVPVTTAHSTAALIAEAGTLTESDPAFAKRTLGAYKYAMSLQLSSELLQDTGVNLEDYLARQAGRAVGNALGVDLITGNASSKPSGILQTSTLGVTGGTGVVGVFTADNLIDLFYSVIAPYRNSSAAGWLMRDATLATARKLKDSQNQYLWQPSLVAGTPETLLGKPVNTDPNVPATAVSAKSVIFGDISAYIVRLAGGIRFERSDDFAFQNDLVTFRCIVRGDGILADQTGAVKHFAGAAT